MSDVSKRLASGTMEGATGSTTFFTVSAASTIFLKSVLISNVGTADASYTLTLNGDEFPLSATLTISDKMIVIPYLDAVLSAGATIGGYCNTANASVKYYISGREITG
jgi:hypothetical protein